MNCPRCGSADVTVQKAVSDLHSVRPGPGTTLGEAAVSSPSVEGGLLAAALGLILTPVVATGLFLAAVIGRWLGWEPADKVRFCHDCGWNEPVKKP